MNSETLTRGLVWWCTPIIPGTLEVEVGGSWSKADQGKRQEMLSDKQTKANKNNSNNNKKNQKQRARCVAQA
jgi:hypothetical protein